MDEYNVIEERIERAQEVNRRIIDAIPSTNSYMPASVSSIMEEIKYKQEKVTYGKRQGSNQFEEIKREPYKNEKDEDILQVIYLPLEIKSNNVSTYKTLPKVKNEFEEAQENGFKGTTDKIEEYLEIRDYT